MTTNLGTVEKNLETCFSNYEAVQKEHLHTMMTESIPDLSAMTQQRENAYIELKSVLDAFIENAGNIGGSKSIPVLEQFESRLDNILQTDAKISNEIQLHKDKLQINLKRLKKGKQAIQGYAGSGARKSPFVLSINK